MTKKELFIELAKPNKEGKSRWVYVTEFSGKFSSLYHENGGSWSRKSGALYSKYILEKQRKGQKIVAYRLNGFNTEASFNQSIRQDIKDFYKNKNCVMLGVNGKSENTAIETDHKDGRKNNQRVADMLTQKLEDFQPLCKAANDIKRQICKRCKETDKRWNAKNIKGNPYDFYDGDENYTEALGCVGCYQYDPVEYRKSSVQKISQEVCENIMQKLYPED
jgi:predicted DNA binding CopG/RHH family protein